MSDIRKMSDEKLEKHRLDVLKEIDRRNRLEVIPDEIDRLRKQYTAAGGDSADLDDKGDDE